LALAAGGPTTNGIFGAKGREIEVVFDAHFSYNSHI
jgi:hypothetical protein